MKPKTTDSPLIRKAIQDLTQRQDRRASEATPADVRDRANAERKRLKDHIDSLNEQLKQAQAELNFWEKVPA